MTGLAVLGGFVLDALFGDPAWLPHPVVLMGKAISALEPRLRARLPKTPQGELLGGGGTVGRRLDFLCQELNREANTTGSKSMNIDQTNLVMDLKALIEQLREQVQNIE